MKPQLLSHLADKMLCKKVGPGSGPEKKKGKMNLHGCLHHGQLWKSTSASFPSARTLGTFQQSSEPPVYESVAELLRRCSLWELQSPWGSVPALMEPGAAEWLGAPPGSSRQELALTVLRLPAVGRTGDTILQGCSENTWKPAKCLGMFW